MRKEELAPGRGTGSAAAGPRSTILCDTARGATAAMFARAVIVALLVLMTAGGPAQAQNCPDPLKRACVLEQALAAARAISDEGARAQALSQIAVVEVEAGKIDEGLSLAQSIADDLWRHQAPADLLRARPKALRTPPAV